MSLSLQYPSTTSDLHVSTVRGLPSEVTLTSTYSGIDHHLSGLNSITRTQFKLDWLVFRKANTELRSLRTLHFNAHSLLCCRTPWSVFQDGTNPMLTPANAINHYLQYTDAHALTTIATLTEAR